MKASQLVKLRALMLSALLFSMVPGSHAGTEIVSDVDKAVMVLVPAGKFIYGIDKAERSRILRSLSYPELEVFDNEFPKQEKTLPAFYIDKFEVTNEKYMQFVKATGHRKPRYAGLRQLNQPKQPVVGVGILDAKKYCSWAGKRLPTEEEWEKAARGPNGNIWPWGNTPSADKYNGKNAGELAPVNVGSYPAGASPYGVMDMAGNVYELTSSIYKGIALTMRGGSYLNAGSLTRTMFRWASGDDDDGTRWLGFRCAMDKK